MRKKPEHILDELLVLNAQNGDSKAMAILVNKWHGVLIKQAFRNTHSIEAAKDIVQDSWQVIVRKLASINDPAKFRVWASSIVYNKSVDWVRNQQKQREVLKNHEYEVQDETEEVDHGEVVRVALKKLPQDQRLILSMFYTDDYSVIEIAQILRLPVGTVKSRLFNARKKLKETLVLK